MKLTQRKLQRQRLFNLTDRFNTACLYVGYTVAVVLIAAFFFMAYPLWFAIIAGIPLAIIGGIPFGLPLGGVPAGILWLLFNWLINVFLPDLTETKSGRD